MMLLFTAAANGGVDWLHRTGELIGRTGQGELIDRSERRN